MIANLLFSSPFILWLIASVIAASLFFSVLNRRRASLVVVLHRFVERQQKRMGKATKKRDPSEDEPLSP